MRIFPMNCNRFIGNFTAASGCFQLVPKYKMEVKLMKNKHQIFLPEISQFQENGSQPLNSHFFKGLTHCECSFVISISENTIQHIVKLHMCVQLHILWKLHSAYNTLHTLCAIT